MYIDERKLCLNLSINLHKAYKNKQYLLLILKLYNYISKESLKAKDANLWQLKTNILSNIFSTDPSLLKQYLPPFYLPYNKIPHKKTIDSYFNKIIIAKTVDTIEQPFNSLKDLIKYCYNTGGSIWIILGILLSDNNLSKKDISTLNHIGGLYALTGIIRNYKYAQQKKIFTLIFKGQSKNEFHNKSDIELNIKNINNYIQNVLNSLQKRGISKQIKGLTLLNFFTKEHIKKFNYSIDSSTNLAKSTYLNLFFKYLQLKLYKSHIF